MTYYEFIIFDAFVKSRHSGENRSPDGLSANALWRTWKNWIPAFAGMTENSIFRLSNKSTVTFWYDWQVIFGYSAVKRHNVAYYEFIIFDNAFYEEKKY